MTMGPLETAASVATIGAFLIALVEFVGRTRRWWRHRARAKHARGRGHDPAS